LNAAHKVLDALGMQYSKDNTDIRFRYITIENNKRRMVYSPGCGGWGPWGMGWGMMRLGWGLGWGGYSYLVGHEKYRYAHLIIEDVDRRTNSVVWQARGSSEVRAPEKSINKLPQIVNGIFKQYPLKK